MLQEEKLSKGKNCRISVVISKSAENTAKEKIPQSLAALRDFRGGDYWTRTSDLLRVKMRRVRKERAIPSSPPLLTQNDLLSAPLVPLSAACSSSSLGHGLGQETGQFYKRFIC